MRPAVPDKVEALTEALAALGTPVRLLPCVCPLVDHQGGALAERLPALRTPVRLLPCVRPLVSNEVGAQAETLATFAALIGLLSWLVAAPFCHTAAALTQTLSAFRTFTGFLSRVRPPVRTKV